MIVIRSEHVEGLQSHARLAFHEEMAAHLRAFSPALCQTLSPDALDTIVRDGVLRAEQYGLTYRGPVRLFLELMFLLGSAFDVDVQYPWAGETLSRVDFDNQMFKAGRLEHLALEYVRAVQGPDDHHATRALLRLEELAQRGDMQFHRSQLDRKILRALDEVFPSKFAYVGREAAEELVHRAELLAGEVFGVDDPRAVAVLSILQFTFGMRCDDDPLYPWIGATLRDPRIVDPKRRAARLERRAVIWLKAVNTEARTVS